jgi:hypothetical protein
LTPDPYSTSGGYLHHEFPAAFSGHWLRLVPERDGVATAQLFYT